MTLTALDPGSLSYDLHSPCGCCQRLLLIQDLPAGSVLGQGCCNVLLHSQSYMLAAILNTRPAIVHSRTGLMDPAPSM